MELAVVLEQAAFGLLPGPLLPTVLASQLIAAHAPRALASGCCPALAGGATAASAVTATGLRARAQRAGGGSAARARRSSARPARRSWSLGRRRPDGRTVWFDPSTARCSVRPSSSPAEPVDLTRDVARCGWTTSIPDEQVLDRRPRTRSATWPRRCSRRRRPAWPAGASRPGWTTPRSGSSSAATIGSFQAIKHKCARLFARSRADHGGRLGCRRGAQQFTASQQPRQFALAAAAAAVLAPQAAIDIALDTVTLLGGIGYTWEHDVHLYWRRAMSLAAILGPTGTWQRRLAELSRGTERRHDLRLDDEPAGLRDWVAATALAQAAASTSPPSGAASWPPRGLAAAALPAALRHRRDASGPGRDRPGVRAGRAASAVHDRGGVGAAHDPRPRHRRSSAIPSSPPPCAVTSPGASCSPSPAPAPTWPACGPARSRPTAAGGINGQKVWTSNAAEADWAICLARTDPRAPKHKGISYFLVDMRTPGVDVRPLREANGGYLFNEVFLTDVFVPDERLVGDPGDGWRLARTTLGNERVNIATGSVSKAGQRHRLPARFLDDLPGPVADEILAEAGALTAEALAFAAMSQRLLLRQIGGLRPGAEASVLKVISAANLARLRRAVLDWHGGSGRRADAGPSHDYLSLPPQLIGGGTVEIQLNVIGERVLGLPR